MTYDGNNGQRVHVRAIGEPEDAPATAFDQESASLMSLFRRLVELAESVGVKLQGTINADLVNVESVTLQAGENHVGQVGYFGKSVRVAPTVTAGTYGAGKCVGGVQSIDVGRVSGGPITLNSVVLQDVGGAAKPTGNILVFNASPASSTTADNGDFTLHADDEAKLIGVIPVTSADWKTPKTKSIAEIAVNREYIPTTGTTLYFLFVADAAFGSAFAATTSFACRYKAY